MGNWRNRMKKMNKMVATAAALILMAPLAACGQEGDKAAEETAEAVDATGNAVEAGADNAMNAAEGAADATADAAGDAADATADAAADATQATGAAVEEVGKDMKEAAK